MSSRIWLCALVLILSATAPGANAREPLVMTVSPATAFAPANLRIQVWVEPDANNRQLEVAADSGAYYRSSLVTLEGEQAPHVVTLDYRALPSGDYQILGVLTDGAGHERASVCQFAKVVSGAGH